MDLKTASQQIGVPASALWALIEFESKWSPNAVNPHSGAIGLIQWLDASSQDLGYENKEDLWRNNKTVSQQLELVVKWLNRFNRGGYKSVGDLYLQVFNPASRSKNWSDPLPQLAQDMNKGIKTPQDYIDFVERIRSKYVLDRYIKPALAMAGAFFAVKILMKK